MILIDMNKTEELKDDNSFKVEYQVETLEKIFVHNSYFLHILEKEILYLKQMNIDIIIFGQSASFQMKQLLSQNSIIVFEVIFHFAKDLWFWWTWKTEEIL